MGLAERMVINIKNRDLRETLQILQTWFSPLFPIGGYSFSHGLEAMINNNLIKTENDILDHLNCLIRFGSFKNDSILIKYSYNGEELNDLALSLCASKERKIETLEMGNSFRKVLKDSWDYTVDENTAYPIIIGKAAKYFNLPLKYKWIRFETNNHTVQVSPNNNTAVVTFNVDGSYLFEGNEINYAVRASFVWTNFNGEWKKIHSHWSPRKGAIGVPIKDR